MAFLIPRVALVTGAARDLGAEIDGALARAGHAVGRERTAGLGGG
jgi:NAD(P)-dependent dehydrogenase (short-subunit alcohol dehydrogenase family)